MNRLKSSIIKELLLLVSDKVGLLFMFVMPLLLVLILTVVQHSAFRRINENKISMLVVNHDKADQSQQFIDLLYESGMFIIEENNAIAAEDVKLALIKNNKLSALYIPSDFSSKLIEKSNYISSLMLVDFNLSESASENPKIEMPTIAFYHDPVLQEAYCYTIVNVIYSYVRVVENSLMIDMIYEQIGFDKKPESFKEAMLSNNVNITQTPASAVDIKPNTTQHNVPAWTIFAMFFIVVSLGNNIVKERLNGSFIRLKTMPINFTLIYGSKMFVYVSVALLQVIVIFSVGVLLFPLMNLPQLILPSSFLALFTVVLITALSAVSYALMIGSLAKTQEQANGIGAVSIIIFAALGGILVPVFVMPDYMKIISNFSPLHWCLEGFYFLFLKGGNWLILLRILLPQIIFITLCQLVTYIQFKTEKIN